VYKYVLCWRYLLTRYLALACIISVMLGVTTLIVVNSVMSGFSTKLKDRLHHVLADVLIETNDLEGLPDPEGKIQQIMCSPIHDKIEAMAPTMEAPAILQFIIHDENPFHPQERHTRVVRLIGIDPVRQCKVDGFGRYVTSRQDSAGKPIEGAGDPARCFDVTGNVLKKQQELHPPLADPIAQPRPLLPGELPPPDPPPSTEKQAVGVILGRAICHFRWAVPDQPGTYKEMNACWLGDDVIITTISGQRLAPVYDRFACVDYFRSEMSEYDSNYVYVPLAHLQKIRGMENRATSIQIKLKNYERDKKEVVEVLSKMFPDRYYTVASWEQKQSSLLAAIDIERGLLNVLLFLIICVAGFGILAIFAMIVVEKTRDIGILKALGASNGGVMKIFLGYGLLLGIVGAVFGTALGLTITIYLNQIEKVITKYTGHEIFNRSVYYFNEIPTNIQPTMVVLVNVGAIGIAVLFSVLPALRAALLHPVKALRYE
jgi:lipoprotein-releasing system permease protein